MKIGGPFQLTTAEGRPFASDELRGAPFAIFFGFTRCPEVCPTTLSDLAKALRQLGPQADLLKVLFVSLDPTRDTPEILHEYVQAFDSRIIGLTGTEAEIARVAKSYRVFWEKVPTGDGNYTLDHTAAVFLMDADGEFIGTITYDETAAVRLEKFRRLIAGGRA